MDGDNIVYRLPHKINSSQDQSAKSVNNQTLTETFFAKEWNCNVPIQGKKFYLKTHQNITENSFFFDISFCRLELIFFFQAEITMQDRILEVDNPNQAIKTRKDVARCLVELIETKMLTKDLVLVNFFFKNQKITFPAHKTRQRPQPPYVGRDGQ